MAIKIDLLKGEFGDNVYNLVVDNAKLLWDWKDFEHRFFHYLHQEITKHKTNNLSQISVVLRNNNMFQKDKDRKLKAISEKDNHYKKLLDKIGRAHV